MIKNIELKTICQISAHIHVCTNTQIECIVTEHVNLLRAVKNKRSFHLSKYAMHP